MHPIYQMQNRQFVVFTSFCQRRQLALAGMPTHPRVFQLTLFVMAPSLLFFNTDETLRPRFVILQWYLEKDWVMASVEATEKRGLISPGLQYH